MRERGGKRAFWARLGLGGLVIVLGTGVVSVCGHSTGTSAPRWLRTISDLIVAPANAERGDRRSRHKGSGDDRQAEAALRRAQQSIQRAEAARKRLQEADGAQKRIQQMQETAATQKRMQDLQRLEASQKKLQQIQTRQQHLYRSPSPSPASNVQAVAPKPTAVDRHRAALEQTMAKLRVRHSAPRREARQQANTDRSSPGTRHQALLTQVMSKLRGHRQDSWNTSRRDDRSSRDGFGGHGRQLQSVMDKLRGRHHADRNNDRFDRGRSGHGHHESRQHAFYSHILTKLSRYGRRSREETVATPQPAPVVTPLKNNLRTQRAELLPGTPDLGSVATTVGSRLPEIVANANSRAASESDSTMSRLGGPQQPASDERSSGDERRVAKSRTQKKDDDQGNDTSAAVKPAGRNLGRRVSGSNLLPPPGSFKPNEILALDMDAAKLARALARNFKVLEKIEYPALGFSLTRLATPDTQNAIIARTTMHEELPSDGFGLNHIYAAGRVAAAAPANADPGHGGKAAPSVPSTPSPGFNGDRRAGACAPDRCFGISVINWQPQLAACARGIKIGIIDTGVDKHHPAFAGVHFEHQDFIPRNAKKPPNHHGTGVFSLLAGNPRSSTPGLVPDATFLVGDAFFADRNGNAMSDTVTMLKALNWLKAAGVDIANLSFAGPRDELVQDAIRELAKTGTVILAAAGNEGQDAPPSYPAAYKEVIAVTAVDRNLAPYVYANRGSHIDVAAPGVEVWTALPNKREGVQTGTSFAVPFVTSVVALSYRPEVRAAHADPLAPKRQALAQLQKNIKAIGGRGQSSIFGAGIVQAPSHCDPRGPAVATKTDGWKGIVQTTPSTNPPTHLQARSWTSTVLPVASRK